MNRRSLLWIFFVLFISAILYYYVGRKNTPVNIVSDTGIITSVDIPSKSITVINSNNEEMVMVCSKKTLILNDKDEQIDLDSLLPSMTIKYNGYRSKQNADLVVILTKIQLSRIPDIIVLSPLESNPITSFPIVLRGYLRKDNQQTYRLLVNNIDQGEIETLQSNKGDMYALFEYPIHLTRKMMQDLEASMEIKIQSSNIEVALIKTFTLKMMKKIELYFGNSKNDPQSEDCTAVFPVEREILTLADPSDILHLHMQGPTASEKEQGYFSSLPFGASINSIEMKDKKIKIDFKSLHAGGSCQIDGILSEISHTMISAYPGSTVTITENGTILSP